MQRFSLTLATVWRLAIPYFRSEDRWAGFGLLAAVIAIELSIVAINVMINQWNGRFFNAVQDRNWDAFVSELLIFGGLAAAFIVLAVYQLYLNQWLQIRWRRWMTARYLADWLDGPNHYRMQLLGDAADNPDQRIAEDINLFVEKTLYLGIGLLSAVVTVLSFVAILWSLSAQAPLTIFGQVWNIPGYLVWAALIYAVLGTWLTHWIGRALIPLNFLLQRTEADFRFDLVRARENSEQIALLAGEPAERSRLGARFAAIADVWFVQMARQKWVTLFTAGHGQIAVVFPYIVVAPAYFSGALQLGGMMQAGSAFSSLHGALAFFVDNRIYRQFAEWGSVVQRLAGFEAAVAAGRAAAQTGPTVSVAEAEPRKIALDNVDLRLPTGAPLLAAHDIAVGPGERVLVNGPSGSGKSTLFRAIAAIWPFGGGRIARPSQARLMMLPQRPYFPVGSLAAAVSYPAPPEAYPEAQLAEALRDVGLPALAERLSEHAHWNRMLSLGEQQRLGLARALLQAPDVLFLDEATASLDEAAEARLYKLLEERLPGTTVVSIGHRSTLQPFHGRRFVLEPDGDRHRLREGNAA